MARTRRKSATSLTVAGVAAAREALLADPLDWPAPEPVDAAGIQLIVAALKAGVEPPEAVRNSAEVRRLWTALGLDEAGEVRLSPHPA